MTISGPDNKLELQNLFVRAVDGDKTAYRAVLLAVMPIVRAYVRGQLRHNRYEHLTEDIVQDTIMAVHLKLHTYERGANPLPWVYTIAKYKMIDQLRRQTHGHKHITNSIDDPHYIEVSEGEGDYEERDTNFDLTNLLNKLDPPQGDIIHALKIEGTSITELAAHYNFSESKIKIIVHRGLKRLQDFVKDQAEKAL